MKIIIAIMCCLLVLSGCKKDDNNANTDYNNSERRGPLFIEKIAIKKDNACWYSHLSMSYSRIDKEQPNSVENMNMDSLSNIFFDGFNICETENPEYYVRVLDENDNVIGKSSASTLSYSIGEKQWDDVHAIGSFLREKLYNRHITIDDLEGLVLTYFSKDLIVELYNEAFDMEPRSLGNYHNNQAHFITKYQENSVEVTVGALVNWGYIDAVNLQFEATGTTPITLTDDQIAEINVSVSEELVSNQHHQVESIPHSDDVITLELINEALDSVFIKDSE